MSGADWGSPYLLADFKRKAGLQEANEYDDDDDLYPRLSVGARKIHARIASIFPNALYQAPAALTMASDRKTASYGSDGNGNVVVPMGNVQIARSLNAFSGDDFMGLVEGRDFYDEGDKVRCVGNRTFSGVLYGRWVPTAPDITSSVAPILNPAHAREFISRQAVIDWSEEGGLLPKVADVQRKAFDREFPHLMLLYKKRYKGGGGLIDPARWYLSAPDLGSSG
jgi:hypothetical protein